MDLVPPDWFISDAEVLTFGINKGYNEDSWKQVDIGRYKASALRHLFAFLSGEEIDEESGLRHLALLKVNIGFLMFLSSEMGENNE